MSPRLAIFIACYVARAGEGLGTSQCMSTVYRYIYTRYVATGEHT